jgi:hypothetical protein
VMRSSPRPFHFFTYSFSLGPIQTPSPGNIASAGWPVSRGNPCRKGVIISRVGTIFCGRAAIP